MSNKLVWAIAILLLLFLFIYSKYNKFWKGILWRFNWWRRWKPNEVLFGIFWDTFIATIAIVVALKLANIEGVATAMFYFLIFSIVCLAFAIVIRIRIDSERNNAPLDVGKMKLHDRITQMFNTAESTWEWSSSKKVADKRRDTFINHLLTVFEEWGYKND